MYVPFTLMIDLWVIVVDDVDEVDEWDDKEAKDRVR